MSIKLQTYSYNCSICNRYCANVIIPASRCSKCGLSGCAGCINKYGVCKKCWSKVSPSEAQMYQRIHSEMQKESLRWIMSLLPALILMIVGGIVYSFERWVGIGLIFGGFGLALVTLIVKVILKQRKNPTPKSTPSKSSGLSNVLSSKQRKFLIIFVTSLILIMIITGIVVTAMFS